MIPSIYINLEDDVAKIVARIKKEKASELVLVCPKRCFLFNDSINLRLLKKQVDMLSKKVFILTMDERGQTYAKEAGFELKHLPKTSSSNRFSDIGTRPKPVVAAALESKSLASVKKTKVISKVKAKKTEVVAEREPENLTESQNVSEAEAFSGYKTQENLFPKELESNYKAKQSKKRFYRSVWAFAVASVLVVLAVVFLVLPQAEVVVYRKQQALTRNLVVSATAQASEVNVSSMIIPVEKVNQTLQAESKFQSQGKKEVGNKASGSVVLYNFTNSPINLRAKTTILKLNNKNYFLKADVLQLKPTKYKNAKTREIDENSLSAAFEIEAENGGEGYNVPAGTRLEISNQIFGSNPQLLYAKASTAVTGGTSRYLSYISDEDINLAKQQLRQLMLENLNKELSAQGLKVEDKAFQLSSEQYVFDHPAGTEIPNFAGKITAELSALAYKKSDLENVALKRVEESLASQGDIEVKLNSEIKAEIKSVDILNQLMILDAHFDGVAIASSKPLEGLAHKLKGKNQATAAELIKNTAQVEKVEITLTPGWQSYLPFIDQNIKVSIK